MKPQHVVVVGATGAVGQEMLKTLAQRNFPIASLRLVASPGSAGRSVHFHGQDYTLIAASRAAFEGSTLALFSAGASVSREWGDVAAQCGALVVDNSSAFRMDADVPLVIPEVNPEALEDRPRNIIANPNCSTIQMLVALKPIQDAVGIARINVATYQAVSGTGKEAIDELAGQTRALFNQQDVNVEVYPKRIAFNVLPQIDVFMENGYTKEEMKMVWETRKIMEDDSIEVNPTAVRVPVFYGHSEAVHIETRKKITAVEARALLEKAPGVVVMDKREPGGYPTPIDAAGNDATYVGRIRDDISHPMGLNLWVVSDNVRKGAALNSVQIAEILIAKYLN